MEQYGNQTTYNIESVLHKNITGCEYYNKTCAKLENWTQVVDEIYETVSDVEPWMSGNARGASTAFCLLFRSVRSQNCFCVCCSHGELIWMDLSGFWQISLQIVAPIEDSEFIRYYLMALFNHLLHHWSSLGLWSIATETWYAGYAPS